MQDLGHQSAWDVSPYLIAKDDFTKKSAAPMGGCTMKKVPLESAFVAGGLAVVAVVLPAAHF
jgi:hypothetical protein